MSATLAESPLVSVIVLTYNGEKFLDAQLESIVSQTFKDIEILVSDDASTDATLDIVEKYRSDPRLKVLRHKSNVGIARNLELALREARGVYVAPSDQDDLWDLRKLEILLDNLYGNDGIFSDSAIVREDGSDAGKSLLQHLGWNNFEIGQRYLRLLMDNCVSGHALLLKRSVALSILPFEPRPVYDQQLAFAAAYTGGLAFVPDLLVKHRQHRDNNNNQIIHGAAEKLPAKLRNRLAFQRIHSGLGILLYKLAKVAPRKHFRERIQFWIFWLLYRRMANPERAGFMLIEYILLWPFRADLLVASSGRRFSARLYKLCRLA